MTHSTRNIAVVVVIERGQADIIVEAARRAGAPGATVFFARGTGNQEHLSLFRIQVEPMKEVAFLIVPETKLPPVVAAITDVGRLNEPGTGILCTVPVGMLVGLEYRQADQVDA